jgi:transketolase
VRQLVTAARPKVTVAGLGPVLLNSLAWLKENDRSDVFAVAQLPLPALDDGLAASVRATGQLVVIEEHAARGGLGEYLCAQLAAVGVPFRLHHHHARGYPTGRYGSQAFHQKQSGLDFAAVQATVVGLTA